MTETKYYKKGTKVLIASLLNLFLHKTKLIHLRDSPCSNEFIFIKDNMTTSLEKSNLPTWHEIINVSSQQVFIEGLLNQ
jgi:hypothetical protein